MASYRCVGHRSIEPTLPLDVHLSAKPADSSHMYEWIRRSRARRNSETKSLRDRGAALVEFALVAPLFFFIVFGGIEVGLLARSYLSLEDVTRRSARIASIERNRPNADAEILTSVQNRIDTLNGELLRVVIFKADSLSTDFEKDLPSGCLAADPPTSEDVASICTAYTASEVAAIAADPTSPAATAISNAGFAPADRIQQNEVINIGVHVEYEYQFVTGFFDTVTLTSTSIEVVEADLDVTVGP